jgi:NAD(P)-dependent dehydrogenase (short-subunit alcohol dehydrogenase family)
MRRYGSDGKVVLITGAARGIGEHTARALASRGARVALVGLEPERLQALAAELGPAHAWFEADVTDQVAVDRAVAGTVAALGGIDVVVANAGVANNSTVAASPVEAVVRTIDVNLVGVVRIVSAALPHVTARRGYVQIIASTASFTVLPGLAAYAASKAGAEAFGNALRLEVAHKGVRVGTVHPAWIDTDLVRDLKAELSTFNEMLRKLPYPLNQTTSVDECVAAIVAGIERRKRKVFVPRSIAVVSALRSLILGPVGSLPTQLAARTAVPRLEAEVAASGRYFGRTSAGLAGRDPRVAVGHEERVAP